MRPFLKWAGGKRWLAKHLAEQMPNDYNRYIEPFLGSGAVFFNICPNSALVSDANSALIDTYLAVREAPDKIFDGLSILNRRHSKELYYETRSLIPDDPIEAAIRFIYLNRTCWNGLYRVNKRNEFNVPIGTKTSVLFSDDDFEGIAKVLTGIDISCADFEETIDKSTDKDVIYVDPPYTVKHNLNGFVKYNQVMFSWDDQVRLRDCLVRARDRGSIVMMSNADHQSIRELYLDFSPAVSMPRASIIAGAATARVQTSELLVISNG